MRATTKAQILALLMCLTFVLESGVSAGPPPFIGGAGQVTPPPRSSVVTDTVFNNLRIVPQGTTATITFTTNQAVRAGASYNAMSNTVSPPQPVVGATSPAGPLQIAGQGLAKSPDGNSPGFTGFTTPMGTSHTITLTGLKSNTLYTTRIWVDNGANAQAQSTNWTFLTLKKRIKITFPSVFVQDNGDLVGAGEPDWIFNVSWAGGQIGGCYPYDRQQANAGGIYECLIGAMSVYDNSNYTFTNTSGGAVGFIFPEENFGGTLPTSFGIDISVEEYDIIPLLPALYACLPFRCSFTGGGSYPVNIPQTGVSFSKTFELDANQASESFYSTVRVNLDVYYDAVVYPANKPVISLFN